MAWEPRPRARSRPSRMPRRRLSSIPACSTKGPRRMTSPGSPHSAFPGGRAYRKPRLSPFASVEGPPASGAALPHPAYAAGLAQDQRRAARNRASEEGSIPCAMLTGHYLLSSRLELWTELERHHLDVVDTRGLAGPDGSDLLNVVLEQPAHRRSVRVRTPRSPGALSMNSRRPVGRPAPSGDVRRQVAGRPAARRSISIPSGSPAGCRSRLLLPASLPGAVSRGCPGPCPGVWSGLYYASAPSATVSWDELPHLLRHRRL